MNFENLQAIIDFATKEEREAVEFYTNLSQKKVMSGAKQMLIEFAEEEKKHVRLLENINIEGAEADLDDYRFVWIKDIKRSDYLMEIEYEEAMGYRDILQLAMKKEEKALKLYRMLQEKSETEGQKKVFKMLRQEEAKHKLALETMYDDYMAEMGD